MTGKTLARLTPACLGLMLIAFAVAVTATEEPGKETNPPPTVAEARQRARLLHGTIHDTLQVVHARYFREGEKLPIPAASLNLVFQELEERDGVKLRWLVVDGQAMNIDNEPQDDFEEAAAKALSAGERGHEATSDGIYRFAGPITLEADCLKCHLPNRGSNKPRTAGLLISMPVEK